MSTGWGEAGSAGDGEHLPGARDLGDGHRIVFSQNPKVYRRLLHSRPAVHKITDIALEICNAANANVNLDPRTVERLSDGQPAYIVEVSNDPGHTRAQAKVRTNGLLGMVDDSHNSTLLKSMDVHRGEV